MQYPIVIHKDSHSDYGVIVPDLPGCFSAGDSIADAIKNAYEAIECHIEGLLLDGEPVPSPKPIETHKNKSEYKDGIWAIVSISVAKASGKAKRINITLPERFLKQLDRYTKKQHGSRSAF